MFLSYCRRWPAILWGLRGAMVKIKSAPSFFVLIAPIVVADVEFEGSDPTEGSWCGPRLHY